MTIGLACQTVLPMSSSGRLAGCAFGVEDIARRHPPGNRPEGRIALADLEIFLAVSGRGVDRAGALLERHVIGQNPERIAIEKRMAEDRAFELRARKSRDHLGLDPSRASPPPAFSKSYRDDVDVLATIDRHIFEFRMKGDGELAGMVHGVVVQIRP